MEEVVVVVTGLSGGGSGVAKFFSSSSYLCSVCSVSLLCVSLNLFVRNGGWICGGNSRWEPDVISSWGDVEDVGEACEAEDRFEGGCTGEGAYFYIEGSG